MSECRFCGQERGPEHPSFLLDPFPVEVCPNMPKSWLGMSSERDFIVTDLDDPLVVRTDDGC